METEQYEINWKNYYNILALHPTASTLQIKWAYLRLARKYHPDRAKDSLLSNRMPVINEAYEVLSDKNRRAKYDERFKSTYGRKLTLEEALRAELSKPFATKLAREQRRDRWLQYLLVPIIVLARGLGYLLALLAIDVPWNSFLTLLFYLLIWGLLIYSIFLYN